MKVYLKSHQLPGLFLRLTVGLNFRVSWILFIQINYSPASCYGNRTQRQRGYQDCIETYIHTI